MQPIVDHMQVVDHDRVEQPAQIGTRRDTVPWPGLLDRTSPAQALARFKHQHLFAGTRQIGGTGKSIVPPTHDDCVPMLLRQETDGGWQADASQGCTRRGLGRE